MNAIQRCPISYEVIEKNQKYSAAGLKLLSRKLTELNDLPFTAENLRKEARARATKMSVQGVQAKLSAMLNISHHQFEIVDQGGHYILKPPSIDYPELPENEDLTMRLAKTIGIEVPLHGMVYGKDGKLTYFIKRFDRIQKKNKLNVEDFAQLSQHTRDTKYQSSMEKVVAIIDKNCTFPQIEKQKLFLRTLFNFLIGNEDMHLKNFSLITREDIITLAPAYDLLNTSIVVEHPKEEIALPLNGKKNNLNKKDFLSYFGEGKLKLSSLVIVATFHLIKAHAATWERTIRESFLSELMKEKYLKLLQKRMDVLF